MISTLRAVRSAMRRRLRLALWQQAIGKVRPRERGVTRAVLIIASDTGRIVGSRGDDAMISVIVQQVLAANPEAVVGVVCASPDLPPRARELGLVAEPIWPGEGYSAYLAALERYDTVVMVGADVMDGHYSEAEAIRYWAMCDLAARSGLRAFVLGCSFSDHIEPGVKQALQRLSAPLTVYARDEPSKAKFDRQAAIDAELVADSAFLLQPRATAPDHQRVEAWVADQHAQGRFVCAFNTHPMIFPENDQGGVAALNKRLLEIFPRLAERHDVSFLLVPHDFRDGARGDNFSLSPLFDSLQPILGDRVLFAESEAQADQLKALVGCADLLVTGRMHLAVGALSMGVPIWGLSPQDKFAGLLAHFGLGDLRLHPKEAEDTARLESFLEDAFSNWAATRDAVRGALPRVKDMARRNFSLLET